MTTAPAPQVISAKRPSWLPVAAVGVLAIAAAAVAIWALTRPTPPPPVSRLLLARNKRAARERRWLRRGDFTRWDDGGKLEDLVSTEYAEDSASVSPDGRWMAYRSTRSRRPEIWVQPVTGSAAVPVSQNGGREPLWSRDGRELYYLEGNKLIAHVLKNGPIFSFGPPAVLFDQPYCHGSLFGGGAGAANSSFDLVRSYDVAKDGRFIMIPSPTNPTSGAGAAPAFGSCKTGSRS